MEEMSILHLERCFFGRLASATENCNDRPYDDWHLSYLYRSGLILIFSVYPDLLGQKVLFFFPASFYSPRQRFFHTSPGILEMTDDTAVIDTLHSRYMFETGDNILTQEEMEELIMTVSSIMNDSQIRAKLYPSKGEKHEHEADTYL